MVTATIALLLFYLWSFLSDGTKVQSLVKWSIFLTAILGALLTLKSSLNIVPAALMISKTWITIGVIGFLLIRARDNRFAQALILLAVLQYFFFMRPQPATGTVSSVITPSLLLSVDAGELELLADRYDLRIDLLVEDKDLTDGVDLPNMYIADVEHGRDVGEMIASLSLEQGVRWIEVNDKEKLQFKPGGTIVDDPMVLQQWAYKDLEMNLYHNTLQALSPVRPAKLFILDSGVQANHEDLTDGYTRLRGQSPRDANGHGTHCAGIAAATTNNGRGVASFSPGTDWVELHSIAVINGFGFAPQSAVVKGIVQAADEGADVISMSLGGYSTDSIQHAYNVAIKYARDKGAIVIAAAGNSSMEAGRFSPANSDGIIAVSAVGPAKMMAPFSNTVADIEMGVAAPGVDILSTFKNGKYKVNSGTSMAAPMVAGLAAVCKAVNPDLSTEAFYQAITITGGQSSHPQQTGPVIRPDGVVRTVGGL